MIAITFLSVLLLHSVITSVDAQTVALANRQVRWVRIEDGYFGYSVPLRKNITIPNATVNIETSSAVFEHLKFDVSIRRAMNESRPARIRSNDSGLRGGPWALPVSVLRADGVPPKDEMILPAGSYAGGGSLSYVLKMNKKPYLVSFVKSFETPVFINDPGSSGSGSSISSLLVGFSSFDDFYVLEEAKSGNDPGADNSSYGNTAVNSVLSIILLLISAKLLEYGLWNLYDGPCDWRSIVCLLIGWVPFTAGFYLLLRSAVS
jgi:hypothetical protein